MWARKDWQDVKVRKQSSGEDGDLSFKSQDPSKSWEKYAIEDKL